MTTRDTAKELHHLLKLILNSDVIIEFSSCIFRIRVKPMAVMDIEITKEDDFKTTECVLFGV